MDEINPEETAVITQPESLNTDDAPDTSEATGTQRNKSEAPEGIFSRWKRYLRYQSLAVTPKTTVDNPNMVKVKARILIALFEPYHPALEAIYGEQIAYYLRKFCVGVPAIEYRSKKAGDRGIVITLALVVIFFILSAIVIAYTSVSHDSLGDKIINLLLMAVGFIAVCYLFLMAIVVIEFVVDLFIDPPMRIFRRALGLQRLSFFSVDTDRWGGVAYIALTMLSGILAVSVPLIFKHPNDSLLFTSFNLYGALVMLFSAFLLAFAALQDNSRILGTYTPPDISAFGVVCELLWAGRGLNGDIEVRRYLIQRLDALAAFFRTSIPKFLGAHGNLPGRALVDFAAIANNIQGLKLWVAFPQTATASEFANYIARVGGALASQNYHYLKSGPEDIQPSAITVSRLSRIIGFLKNILFGFLPGGALILVKALHIQLGPQVEASWILSSVLWAVVSMLATQPDFKDRISATKDISSLITQSQK
jgi:hypothetical protein